MVNQVEGKPKYKFGDIIVIDEASMIQDVLYYKIMEHADPDVGNLKIIFTGDKKQLAPVNNGGKISVVFRQTQGKVITLKKVERTGDNAILKEATALREDKPLSYRSSKFVEGKGVVYINPKKNNEIRRTIQHFAPKLKENPDFFRILTGTNDSVEEYNAIVRSYLGYGLYPEKGETIIGYVNRGYLKDQEEPYALTNSESYKVIKTENPITIKKKYKRFSVDEKEITVGIEAVPVYMESTAGYVRKYYYVDLKNNSNNRAVFTNLGKEKSYLKKMGEKASQGNMYTRGTQQWYWRMMSSMDEFQGAIFLLNDNITESDVENPLETNYLQEKTADFGYAMTIHKSQGSTFTHVLMDDDNIEEKFYEEKNNSNTAHTKSSTRDFNPPATPQISNEDAARANANYTPVGEKKKSGIDFKALAKQSGKEPQFALESTSQNNDSQERANTIQQLKYVAMTRATDTVTVVSSKSIVEDTVLNHIGEAEQAKQKEKLKEEKQKVEQLKKDLGNDERAEQEIKDAVQVAKRGLSFEEALAGQETFFTPAEQEQIKRGLGNRNLQVMSVSRYTDPAFFSRGIIRFLKENAEKSLDDPTRVVAMEIWTKHDGLPMVDVLEACKKYRVAPMVSFSITGLGNTSLEKGVMKYQDLLSKIEEYIKQGLLNPVTTTVRVDPILVGVTNMEDVKKIIAKAKSLGIKKFVTSLTQSYGYLDGTNEDRKVTSGINKALASEGKAYDWDKYYGRVTQEDINKSNEFARKYRREHPEVNKLSFKKQWPIIVAAGMKEGIRIVTSRDLGKIHFVPKQEYINEVGKVLTEIDKDPEITIQTCSFHVPGLKSSACLDPLIIERITGVDVTRPDGTYDVDQSRPECMCYGCHGDFFRWNEKKCASSCAYCYAGHSEDNPLSYYNEDGSLKDTAMTRTSRPTLNRTNLQVEKYDSRYTLQEKSPLEYFNRVGELLRASNWHVEFYDKRSDDGKIHNSVMTISLEGQPEKGFFELVKDVDLATGLPNNDYSVHFKTRSKKGYGGNEYIITPLADAEKKSMFKALAWAIPDGANVSTWGELSEGGIHALDRFKEFGFTQTGTRKVKHKNGGDLIIPVLTKGAVQQTNTQQQTQQFDVSTISNKTAAFGVVIDANLKRNYQAWQQQNPEGIVAYRVNYNQYHTPAEVEKGHIGNPFSENSFGPETVQYFYDWIVSGINPDPAKYPKATEEFRQAIIKKLLATPNNTPILYYKELDGHRPSHATVLGYLVNNKQLLPQQAQQQQTTLPGPETKMDIWWGTGKKDPNRQNADLSNFAPRHIDTENLYQLNIGRYILSYPNVEAAFQAEKLFYSEECSKLFIPQGGMPTLSLTKKGEELIEKLSSVTGEEAGKEAKKIGRTIPGLKRDLWERDKHFIMKKIMKESFKQNEGALKRLLATGDATLTHVKGGEWAEAMPELLMEVRKELREEYPELIPNQQTTPTAQAADTWSQAALIPTPTGRRSTTYNLQGQAKQTYYVENGHIYNKDGKEVYAAESMRTHKNKILANLAVQEGRAVVVTHARNGHQYVVNNRKQIISVASGEILKWQDGHGDRTHVLSLAEKEFADLLAKQPNQSTSFDISKAEFYSGAAEGSDTAWGEAARAKGIKVKDYTTRDWDALPKEWKEKLDREYQEVVNTLGVSPWDINSYAGKLVRRDMMQADKADAVFAVGKIARNGYVDGGTKYATTRGIIRGIPVYLYDREAKQWKLWNPTTRRFEITQEPILTPHAAVVGTRGDVIGKNAKGRDIHDITPEEKQVIKNVIEKTLNSQKQQAPVQQPKQIAPAPTAPQVKQKPTLTEQQIQKITKQVIDHVRAQGIKVFGRDAMMKRLDELAKKGYNVGYLKASIEEQNEMAKIKAKAQADGTFMKAPNGKPTNLNERQWLQVRTKNFIKWFGDWINDPTNASKVVDENGEPLVVYHGTNADFTEFIFTTPRKAFYFGNKEGAKGYTTTDKTMPLFVNIKNPLLADNYNIVSQFPEVAKDNGHDGIIWKPSKIVDKSTEFVAFEPNQIKSATDNNGAFSTENDDIQMFIGKRARAQFEQQLIKARPDLGYQGYALDGIEFEKSLDTWWEDEYYATNIPQDKFNKWVENGLIKKYKPGIYKLTEKGKEEAATTLYTGIKHALDFLNSLKDTKDNTAYIKAAVRWIANSSITLPADNVVARQAFDIARERGVDVQKYKTLGELIASPEMQPKKKEREKIPFSPEEAKSFSNKRTVTTENGREFTVYDIENTEEGLRETCKILAANFEVSPWCLSTFTKTGKPTESAVTHWNYYNALPRKIAFENGKPVAFHSGHEEAKTLNGFPILTIRGKKYIFPTYLPAESPTANTMIANGLVKKDKNAHLELTELGEQQLKNTESWWDLSNYIRPALDDSINSEQSSFIEVDNNFDISQTPEEVWQFARKEVEKRLPITEEQLSKIIEERIPTDFSSVSGIASHQLLVQEAMKHAISFFAQNLIQSEELTSVNDKISKDAFGELTRNNFIAAALEHYDINYKAIKDSSTIIDVFDLEHSADELPFLIVQGENGEIEIHGFVDPETGDMYVDETTIKPEHPLHEYTHIWDKAVFQRNRELWNTGVKLMKKFKYKKDGKEASLWDEVVNDPNYGGKWKKKLDEGKMSNEDFEFLVGSEVHAQLVGKNGEKFLEDYAAEHGEDNLISKLKKWLLDAWNALADTFGMWSKNPDKAREVLSKLTLADFNHMTVRDFINMTNLEETPAAPESQREDEANNPTEEKIFNAVEEKEIEVVATNEFGESVPMYGEILAVKQTPEGYSLVVELDGKDSIIEIDNNFKPLEGSKFSSKDERLTLQSIGIAENSEQGFTPLKDYVDSRMAPEAPTDETPVKNEDPTVSSLTTFLPNYAELVGIDPQIKLKGEWQAPKLQELDNMLTNPDLTADQKQGIINKIVGIIKARDEKGINKSISIQERLAEYRQLNKEIDELKKSKLIKSYEVRQIAEMIVNSISDMITEIKQNPEAAKEMFPELNIKASLEGKSRKDIVIAIGIDNFLQLAKKRFQPSYHKKITNTKDLQKAFLINKNWHALVTFAADYFVMNEGFGIRKDYSSKGYKIAESQKLVVDPNNPADIESIREVVADEQEHWQIEARTIDALNSMTELVRLAIHNCYLLDENGEKKISQWGIPERVNKGEAVHKILRWVQGATTFDEMLEKLEAKKSQYTWVQQLLDQIKDKEGDEKGSNADLQSQFFSVMNRHYQHYSITRKKKGKYVVHTVNDHIALNDAIRGASSLYQLGEHPLFTLRGVNMQYFNKLKQYYDTAKEVLDNYNKARNEAYKKGMRADEVRLDVDEWDKARKALSAASKMLGFTATPEEAWATALNEKSLGTMVTNLGTMVSSIYKGSRVSKEYNPFNYEDKNGISGALKKFYTPIADVLEDDVVSAFYDDGKMYQSYVIPSFMTKLMVKFSQDPEKVKAFMEEEYGKSEWFRFKDGKWRLGWLEKLYRMGGENVFDHKVELNFNKHNYMRTMSDNEYILSLIANYFSETANAQPGKPIAAWFRVPMLSNKPSSEFIRFWCDQSTDYQDNIVGGERHEEEDGTITYSGGLYDMFLQEVSRIQTVNMRGKSKGDPGFIKNFDTNGRQFCFLPFLNPYLKGEGKLLKKEEDNKKLSSLLKDMIDTTKKLNPNQEAELNRLVKEAIKTHIKERVDLILANWEKMGIIAAAEKVDGVGVGRFEKDVKAALENFLWNDYYASKNILQLTIGDTAFYKDAEDLQKRLAQIHAPGIRPKVDAVDYKGIRVSKDGKYRTIVLKDFDNFRTNLITNITEVFSRKIARAKGKEKEALEALLDSLVRKPKTRGENDKGGVYWNINVADAQAYSSPTSYRKKALMFGKWSQEAESIYNKIIKGEATTGEIKVAFQPLKPFVYSRIEKSMDVDNAPITTVFSPFQAKNAEYLLIMADAMIQGEVAKTGEISRPNLLRDIFDIMEDSAYDGRERDASGKVIKEGTYNGKGIDTVQFESAIKSSLQTPIRTDRDTVLDTDSRYLYHRIKNQIYKFEEDADGNRIYREYDNVNYVYEANFEDYCLQQEVPEHFKNHEQAHGSQIRMITPSDLDRYIDDTLEGEAKEADSNRVWYEWVDPDGTPRRMTAEQYKAEYERVIAANINRALNELSDELGLGTEMTRQERNMILSEFLQREIVDSPRYGVDLFQACSIDPETGEFRIPKGDPIQSKRIEQLINSLIKNRINKQTIPGGPIVQVSNFGTAKQLHIRFADKKGKKGDVIQTEEEFNEAKAKGGNTNYENYDAYCADRQGGIAYFEVFAPIWDDDIAKRFTKSDGTIDMEAIEATNPELLRMISYRIPTEDKYSCAPMKIVGFLPKEAGEAIMLPYELTSIDGSDFDVDKRYVMFRHLSIEKKNKDDVEMELMGRISSICMKVDAASGTHYAGLSATSKEKLVHRFIENPEARKNDSPLMKALWDEFIKIGYKTKDLDKDKNAKEYNDNKIISMTEAVLTHERTADKILNPGNFDEQKKIGYAVSAMRNPKNDNLSFEELEKMDLDELKERSYEEKDLTWLDTQVQFYHQNNAGSSLIGVFAVNKVAHATLESNGLYIDVEALCGKEALKIAGFSFVEEGGGEMSNLREIDRMYDTEGNLIGKTLEDPVLDLMNINMTTAGMLTTMLRMGMPFRDAALFLSQSVIRDVLAEFDMKKLEGNYTSLENIIYDRMREFEENASFVSSDKVRTIDDHLSRIRKEEISREELISNLRDRKTEDKENSTNYKVLNAFLKIKRLADEMRNPTLATRFNSISSAVGPLIIDNIIMRHKMDAYNASTGAKIHIYRKEIDRKTGLEKAVSADINTIFGMHPILQSFAQTFNIAEKMFADMPIGGRDFSRLLTQIKETYGSTFQDKFFKNKKLLDQLATFYQSYMVIASGFLNDKDLNFYIEKFPNKYINTVYTSGKDGKRELKPEYADNALIKAIKLIPSSKTDRTFLSVDIAGQDAQVKEDLSSAWEDLHNQNPELSKDLFAYCFFRAGIGFSPKTFISLLDTYVKENLKSTVGGKEMSYVDIFRKVPSNMNHFAILDQFIRNNWTNGTLVPTYDGKGSISRSGDDVSMLISDPEELTKLAGIPYIKTEEGKETWLWRLLGKESDRENQEHRMYVKVKPLGDNNEFLQISLDRDFNPENTTTQTWDNMDDSNQNVPDNSEVAFSLESAPEDMTDIDSGESRVGPSISDQAKDIAEEAGYLLEGAFGVSSGNSRKAKAESKASIESLDRHLKGVLYQKGIEITKEQEEEAKKETDKYC